MVGTITLAGMARFIDRVVLHLQAGDGGHGCGALLGVIQGGQGHNEPFV